MKKTTRFLLCVSNRGYAASLIKQKVYKQISDPTSERHGMVRLVDESGEDYAFPSKLFVNLQVPMTATRAFARAS